jgi:transcriptional regulator with XRE-family HTH domain
MSVTISESGGKLSKRERPQALRKAIKAQPDIDLEKLASAAGITRDELNAFLAGDSTPDVPAVEAMAKYLGVELPEINVVDFFKSGYVPEAMVNFLALLGWSTGDKKEIMPLDELIACFDITRLTKSNSLFDRGKLVAFNTEHIKILSQEKSLAHLKAYLKAVDSPVASANNELWPTSNEKPDFYLSPTTKSNTTKRPCKKSSLRTMALRCSNSSAIN